MKARSDRLTGADLDRLEAAVTDSHLREDNGVPGGGAMVMPAREVGALLAEVREHRPEAAAVLGIETKETNDGEE